MTATQARELFLIMTALNSRMRELKAEGNFAEMNECHDLWLGLEEQWDKLPARSRHKAVGTSTNPSAGKWYAFYYESPRSLKSYLGPFDTKVDAYSAADDEAEKYEDSRSKYRIKRLSDADFTELWGAAPQR